MNDIRNKALAEVAKPDDFIISDNLTSLMLSVLSENNELKTVLEDLFSTEGCEIYLKPASNYVPLDKPVSFYTVLESAARKGEVAMGYRILKNIHNSELNFGISLTVPKGELVTFSEEDRIAVLAN